LAWDEVIKALAPSVGDRILDIGAGKGDVAAGVLEASKGAEIYAIDPNEGRVAFMKKNRPNLRSSVARAEGLPFPDSHFDKAYTTMALHHYADLSKALQEIARVLKPGGTFVVLELDPHSAKGRLSEFSGKVLGEHMNLMPQEDLEARIRQAEKFTIISSTKLGSSYLIQSARNGI
jgi:ubiquinone/menaquinone biosynthesis C-methylase UbiE